MRLLHVWPAAAASIALAVAASAPAAQASVIRSIEKIAARIETTEVALRAASRSGAATLAIGDRSGQDVVREWQSYDIGDQRAIVRALLDIKLHPTGRGKRAKPGQGVEIGTHR